MAWVTAGAALFSSIGGGISAKKKAKQDQKNSLEQIAAEGTQALKQIQFKNASDYYYKQLDRQEAKRGLDQFRQFSTVKDFAPEFKDTNPGPVVPEKPDFNNSTYANPAPAAGGHSSSGGLVGALLGGAAGYLLGR